jgi:hypothetical protein
MLLGVSLLTAKSGHSTTQKTVCDGIVKLTDFMEMSLIAMPAKLLILGPG